MYANEHKGWLPNAKRNTWSFDDYAWFNGTTWDVLRERYGAHMDLAYCRNQPDILDGAWGLPIAPVNADTYLGWVYWGNREDSLWVPTAGGYYISPKKLGKKYTPSSQTLWTCYAFDSRGQPWGSFVPHVGTGSRYYASGRPIVPTPDGLAVSRLDGSASFVPWPFLRLAHNFHGFWFEPS